MPTEPSEREKKIPKYDLDERLIRFAVSILELADTLPNTRASTHISGQIARSGTSPAPNYGEARGAESRRDFLHKMNICLKELRETLVWLKIIKLRGLVRDNSKSNWLLGECDELISIFVSSVKTAKRNSKSAKAD